MSAMHHDTSADLKVVGAKLKEFLGVQSFTFSLNLIFRSQFFFFTVFVFA